MVIETEGCTRFRWMSTSTHVKPGRLAHSRPCRCRSGRPGRRAVLPADGPAASRIRDGGRPVRRVQGARRPGPVAADVDDRLGAGRGDLRLRPDPGLRGVRVDHLAPPEDLARGGPGRRRTPGELGLLPAPAGPDAPAGHAAQPGRMTTGPQSPTGAASPRARNPRPGRLAAPMPLDAPVTSATRP